MLSANSVVGNVIPSRDCRSAALHCRCKRKATGDSWRARWAPDSGWSAPWWMRTYGRNVSNRNLPPADAAASFTAAQDHRLAGGARALLLPRSALHQSGNHHRRRTARASIAIPMADSITTWRMAMLASTTHGALGSATSSLKVFQDFFVDLDLPVTLTQGDRVSIPVAVYNYSGARGDVSLKLQPDDWFSLVDDGAEKSVAVESGPRGRFAVHARGQAHRQIQAHALARTWTGDGESRGHRGPRNRSHSQRPRAEPRLQRTPGNRRAARVEFPGQRHSRRQQDLRPPLSRPAEPGHRRHGQHPAHARRLLRADLVQHLSQRAGARLHEAHQEADAGSPRQGRRLTSPTAISACSPSKCPAADSPGSARRRPTRS